ncbi:MAG: hypothetical protein KDC71_12040 [Acidobacteria bacterium]|nr:hypothetical protein [Acidobacteriota bacterium]
MPILLLFFWAQDIAVTVTGSGGPIRQTDGTITFNTYFRMEAEGLILTADQAAYRPNKMVEVHGNIKIDLQTDQGYLEIYADQGVFDLSTQSGEFTDVAAQFSDEFYFVGKKLTVMGKDRFFIESGQLSSCNQPTAHWSIAIHKAWIEREGYARLRNASFRIGNVPVFYLPYMIIPAFSERRTGLLTPQPGDSSRNGYFLGVPFYWAPRRDLDFTLTPTFFQEAGLRLGLEARYKPTFQTQGVLNASYIRDRILADATRAGANVPIEDGKPIKADRFRLQWEHEQPLGKGLLLHRWDGGSDFQIDRDYVLGATAGRVRDYSYQTQYSTYWGNHAIFVDLQKNQRILSDGKTIAHWDNLPSVQIFQPAILLGDNWVYRSRYYLDHWSLRQFGPLEEDAAVFRAGVDASVSTTKNLGDWIHSRTSVGLTGAYWRSSDDSATQGGPFIGVELLGPRLYKAFGPQEKWTHFVEFGLDNRLGTEGSDPFLDHVILDELDARLEEQGRGGNTTWKIRSRFYQSREGFSQPWLDLELRQRVYWNSDQTPPLELRARIAQNRRIQGNALVQYNPETGEWETLTLYSNLQFRHASGQLGYVRRSLAETNQDSLIGSLNLNVRKTQIRYLYDYDFQLNQFKSQELGLTYMGACMGVSGRFVSTPFVGVNADQEWFQLVVHFRNLGELGRRF